MPQMFKKRFGKSDRVPDEKDGNAPIAAAPAETPSPPAPGVPVKRVTAIMAGAWQDDGELIAVISAAVSTYLGEDVPANRLTIRPLSSSPALSAWTNAARLANITK